MNIEKPSFRGDDYDFAAGSIKGLRSWEMDDKGRLVGVTHPAVWLPGENVAVCKARPRCPEADPYLSYRSPSFHTFDTTAKPFCKPCGVAGCDGTYHRTNHAFDPTCECGFWAYDEVGFEAHGKVTGVIEGYGKTTIGTRGFRCEKAKIVALCREDDETLLSLSRWLRLKQLYPDAQFFDDFDDMVIAHGEVMKSWCEVGEDFWTEDATPTADTSSQMARLQSQRAALSRSLYYHPRSQRWHTGGIA